MSKETEHILELCSRIKSKRVELRLTQGQLAKKSGVSKGTISRYEKATGDEQPTFGVVMKLSEALGVTAEWIYNGPADEEQIHNKLNADISRYVNRAKSILNIEKKRYILQSLKNVVDLESINLLLKENNQSFMDNFPRD
ncbi:MAG: helix-turn-helix transcriptional regulator [bacterium]|nr:helix-turn-helix transcriptional regulator [bacterium]